MTFTKGFGAYIVDGDSIDCVVDGITYTARVVFDADTQVEDAGCYDDAAVEAWKRDEWHYYGVVIDAEIRGWERTHIVSLWGIEGNFPGSDNSYLLEVANQLLPDAIELVKKDGMA